LLRAAGAGNICVGLADVMRASGESGVNLAHVTRMRSFCLHRRYVTLHLCNQLKLMHFENREH
jgi:hypothetical protein